jgi:hypothetical protein
MRRLKKSDFEWTLADFSDSRLSSPKQESTVCCLSHPEEIRRFMWLSGCPNATIRFGEEGEADSGNRPHGLSEVCYCQIPSHLYSEGRNDPIPYNDWIKFTCHSNLVIAALLLSAAASRLKARLPAGSPGRLDRSFRAVLAVIS